MRLNQVTVYSTDVERAADFYRRLGLTQIVENYPDYARFLCPVGDATFSVERRDERPDRPSAAVFFECDDVDGEVARLKSAGFAFASDPEDKRWLWREAALDDPDGNRIVLYHAGANRIDPPWRLPDSQ